jgi:ABC-2 type transport system permease protein
LRQYTRLAWRFLCLHTTREMQYRAHFLGTIISSLAEVGLFLVFIESVLGHVEAIGDWNRPRMYVLYGTFVLVYALAGFFIEPNASALAESVRRGELDYIFTKPVDAQAYVSLRTYDLPSLANVCTGAFIVLYGLLQHPAPPSAWMVGAYLVLLLCALAIIYSLWLLSVLYVFKAIRMDNIPVLFVPILQFARYPITGYPRPLQSAFRFVLPLVFVATVPAETLLGLSSLNQLGHAVLTALLCLGAARVGWLVASRSYASASS